MSVISAAMRGFLTTLQSAATTGNGLVLAIPPSFTEHVFTIQGSAGVAAGAVQVEAADAPDYAGTWAPQGGSPVTVQASKELTVNLTGIYPFLRARISTDIVSGTVTVTYKGN